jgi:ribonuclease P protein component
VIFRFPKSIRLCKRYQYQRLISFDERHIGRYVIIDMRVNYLSHIRLGITASRRYGKAHIRNRFKRIVREAFRQCRHELIAGVDINVKPRTAALKAKSMDIKEDLMRFLSQK